MKPWPKGASSEKFKADVAKLAPQILTGKMLVIDPASRSAGYSYWVNAEMVDFGHITMNPKLTIQRRLRDLYVALSTKFETPDLVVIEKIRGATAHAYLGWSCGVIVAAVCAPHLIELPIGFWKACVGEGYEKADDQDAKVMGEAMVRLAKEMSA
jgi:Holliday junction resolvasome RuvABC endonuclease subunit